MKIGLVYIKGSVPGFEDFGNIPTDLVKSNGLVNGVKASKELDGIIIPGGTIVESDSITDDLAVEIKKIASQGKFVLGICSGFQALSTHTDIGRKSPCPIIKKGLGLLDVKFSPLISNDRIKANITNKSFLTKKTDEKEIISGFHSHTYGHIEGEAIPLIYSSVNRVNYSNVKENKILSGVKNDDGNVVGLMVHGCLDENPFLIDNIFDFLGASHNDVANIFKKNESIKEKIQSELGIDTGIYVDNVKHCNEFKKSLISHLNQKTKTKLNNFENNIPPTLMIGSTSSDSGKTFITTGIAGALVKKGLKVCVLKVGPDIRDLQPSLYLTKSKIEEFSSIKIGNIGWMDVEKILKRLKTLNYDFVLIEGVMSVFTGFLNEKTPYSGCEIATSSNIPMLLISGVNKGGIESAAIDLVSHVELLQKIKIDVKGIVLNKVYDMDIFKIASKFIQDKTAIKDVLAIPKIKMDERSTTPEVEIKLEDFSFSALEAIEENIDLKKIIKMGDRKSVV